MFRTQSFKVTLKIAAAAFALLMTAGQARAQATATSTATSQVTIAAGLGNAAGLAVDPLGNVYVNDSANNVLLQIPGANGAIVPILTGLTSPGQVAVDVNRNVYVANGTSNVVLKFIYTAGALNLNTPVTVGTGLGTVTGVAVDLTGNVYIVDSGKKQIVKVPVTGAQTVLATALTNPKQIAVDRAGDVFFADAGANAVYYLAAGAGAPLPVGTGFNAPSGVATDSSNNLYVADTGNSLVKEIPYSVTGPLTTGQITLAATVTSPTTLAVDSRNTLYIGGSGTVAHFSIGSIYFGLIQTKATTQVTPVVITFTTSVQAAAIKVVTTGYTGLDFVDAGGGTCAAGVSYSAGQSCTVNTTFTPLYPGPRLGAIVFYDASNKVLSRTFIGGGGIGPLLTIDPAQAGAGAVPPSTSVVSVVPTRLPGGAALNTPHGIHTDAIGNIFIADTNNSRVLEIYANGAPSNSISLGTQGLNDANINGAGDLIVPDVSAGRVTVTPYENGTWNNADLIVLATGYGRNRYMAIDVGGNMVYCDATAGQVYFLPFYGTPAKIVQTVSKSCLGTAVDLYGNIGIADSAANQAVYVPASGAPAYAVGSGFGSPWGIAFDASGSMYVSQTTVTSLFRIPNENGTLVTTDQQAIYGNKDWGMSLDPAGNILTVPVYGTTAPASGYNYLLLPRSNPVTVNTTPVTIAAPMATFGTAVIPIAIGVSAPALAFTVGNAGNQAPVYTYPTGLALLTDLDDFPVGTAANPTQSMVTKPPPLPQCNFTTSLQPAFDCYFSVNFTPQSGAATRTASVFLASQGVTTPQVLLTGYAGGTAATTASGLAVSLTSPAGVPGPFQPIVITATAASAATGSVTLYVDGVGLPATELSAGVATFSLPAGLAAGPHTVTATYSGDKTYVPVTVPVSIAPALNVASAKATLTIASSALDANVGQAVTFTGTVAGQTGLSTPSGTLTFFDGTKAIGTAQLNNGYGSLTTTTLAAGTHAITYVYAGDTTYAMGTSPAVSVVIGTFTATTATVTITPVQPPAGYAYGTALTVVVAVTPATGPTGTVLLNIDGAVQSSPLTGGKATFTISPNAGNHVLVTSYSGDGTYASSSATTSFITNKVASTTTIAASSVSFAAGSNVTLTATVTSIAGTPTGTVTFKNLNTPLGTAVLNSKGVATITTSALPGGMDPVTATYSGSNDNNPSASVPLTINSIFNTTALTVTSSTLIVYYPANPNSLTGALTLNIPATVVVPPSGTIAFTLNGAAAGTVALANGTPAGTLILNTTQLLPGVNKVTASYSGDNDYLPSTTPTSLSFYVVPTVGYDGDYSLSATPNPLNVSIGTIANGVITVTPISKYFGYVQLTCAGLPLYTSCVMQPDQIFLDGTGTPQTASLAVLSQLPILVGSLSARDEAIRVAGMLGAPLLLAMLLGSFRRGRRWLRSAGVKGLLTVFLLCAVFGSMTACGGHPPIATIAGTYTVNITGSGSGPIVNGTLQPIVHTYATQMTFK